MSRTRIDNINLTADPPEYWKFLRNCLHLPKLNRDRGLLALLVSVTLVEIAGNIVYMVILERAYQTGGEAASVGGVLLVQSVPQVLLGLWAGNLVDRLGKRRATITGTIAYTGLAIGLSFGESILAVYLLAFLIMLVRLTLTPARLALVSQLNNKENLVTANTALSIVTGIGLFLGPVTNAAITHYTNNLTSSLIVASMGLLLSLALLFPVLKLDNNKNPVAPENYLKEMRIGWQFIRQHSSIWKVLLCLLHFTLIMGAVTLLIPLLSHSLGLGPEGTGIFFAVIGIGGLIGSLLAGAFSGRLGTSLTLLLAGMLAPAGVIFVGLTKSQSSAILALLVTAISGASLNIIVFAVLQRLSPANIQGRVFGVVQSLVGAAWLVSLAAATVVQIIWPGGTNIQDLFLITGGSGLGLFLLCWLWHWRPIINACETCKPRFQVLGAICQMMCSSPSQSISAACKITCDNPLGCLY